MAMIWEVGGTIGWLPASIETPAKVLGIMILVTSNLANIWGQCLFKNSINMPPNHNFFSFIYGSHIYHDNIIVIICLFSVNTV